MTSIANTILQQLGGNKFIAMTGAKGLAGGSNSLQFHFPKGANKANICRITLQTSDTYMVEFWNYSARTLTTKNIGAPVRDIYADQLRDVFTQHTGLATSL